MTNGYLIKIVVSLTMMLTAVTAQENVDAIEKARQAKEAADKAAACLLYTSPSPRDGLLSRMPSSAWKKKEKE